VGVLGFLAGAGVMWSATGREPAAIAPVPVPPTIVVQPAPVVIAGASDGVGGAGGEAAGLPGAADGERRAAPVAAPTDAAGSGDGVATQVVPVTPASGAGSGGAGGKVNLNTATAAELELLPGIGPALASRILAHRARIGRFTSITQLDDVEGIGPRTMERLAPLVVAE
jgi:competence protein ComEA